MPDTLERIQRCVRGVQRMAPRALEISREYDWLTRQIQWAVWIGQMVKTQHLSEEALQKYLQEVEETRKYLLVTLRRKRRFHPERSHRKFP